MTVELAVVLAWGGRGRRGQLPSSSENELLTSFLWKLSVCSRKMSHRLLQIQARIPSSLTLTQPLWTMVCALPAPVPATPNDNDDEGLRGEPWELAELACS